MRCEEDGRRLRRFEYTERAIQLFLRIQEISPTSGSPKLECAKPRRTERRVGEVVANQLQQGKYDNFGRTSIDGRLNLVVVTLVLHLSSGFRCRHDQSPLRLNRQFCYSSALQTSIFGRLIRLHGGGRLG